MPRLHWFWRGAIASLCGGLSGQAYFFVANYIQMSCNRGPHNLVYAQQPYGVLAGAGVLAFMVTTAVGVAGYAFLTRRLGPAVLDGETHCRKCGYILRGITEPRCPECGERI